MLGFLAIFFQISNHHSRPIKTLNLHFHTQQKQITSELTNNKIDKVMQGQKLINFVQASHHHHPENQYVNI